jgi:hypothetical protein
MRPLTYAMALMWPRVMALVRRMCTGSACRRSPAPYVYRPCIKAYAAYAIKSSPLVAPKLHVA